MKRRITSSLTLALLTLLSVHPAASIEHQVVLTLRDGTTLVGQIEKEQGGKITFRTSGGVGIELLASDVSGIERAPQEADGGLYQYHDPNYTRLFFAPTARTLKGGTGYFADYYIFFPSLAYGATDRLTLYGAMSIIPGLGLSEQLFFFAPKLGIVQEESFALAAGFMAIDIPESDIIPGIVYGVSTWGTKDSSLTAGAGWGWVRDEGDWEYMDRPMIMVGGEHRVASSMKLLTENWWVPIDEAKKHPILSFGVRFFGEHLAADIGFFHVVGSGMEGFPFIPWVDFAYNF